MNSDFISSAQAYFSLKLALEEIAPEVQSADLATLAQCMEIRDSKPMDPAYECEWRREWGAKPWLPANEAFSATVRFVDLERNWSEELVVKRIISEAKNDLRAGAFDGVLYRMWARHIRDLPPNVAPEPFINETL